MCGIVGFLDKTKNERAPVGQTIFKMLEALGRRGPDSAGVAIFNSHHDGDFVLRIKLGDQTEHALPQQQLDQKVRHIVERVQNLGPVDEVATTADYLRLVVDYADDPRELERLIESSDQEIEVVSMGRSLDIVKQVGSPKTSTPHITSRPGSAATASATPVFAPSRS